MAHCAKFFCFRQKLFCRTVYEIIGVFGVCNRYFYTEKKLKSNAIRLFLSFPISRYKPLDKRLIGRLSAPKGEAEGNIRRIEFLNFEPSKSGDIEPNLNEIKAIIDKLRREEITSYEEDELDKTEMDMEKFSTRSPTPFERRVFSDRLLKIVKMMSKYNVAN